MPFAYVKSKRKGMVLYIDIVSVLLYDNSEWWSCKKEKLCSLLPHGKRFFHRGSSKKKGFGTV